MSSNTLTRSERSVCSDTQEKGKEQEQSRSLKALTSNVKRHAHTIGAISAECVRRVQCCSVIPLLGNIKRQEQDIEQSRSVGTLT